MIPGFHGFDLIIILVIALLIFGPKRLPEMGSSIGRSIKEFRKGMSDLTKDHTKDEPIDEPMPMSASDLNRLSSSSSRESVVDAGLPQTETVGSETERKHD